MIKLKISIKSEKKEYRTILKLNRDLKQVYISYIFNKNSIKKKDKII